MTSTGHHWRDQAACKGADTDIFYPEPKTGRPTRSAYEDALAYCARCPVTQECLSWAIKNDEHGIWGGRTPSERSSTAAPVAHGTPAGYWRHRRARQKACQLCRVALAEYQRAIRERKKGTA